MQTAKIFINGRSQAVRLPKEFRFSGKDVFIKKAVNIKLNGGSSVCTVCRPHANYLTFSPQ